MLLPSVFVVIPALNEARNIPHVFARMPADVHQIVLVDGYSVDGTAARPAQHSNSFHDKPLKLSILMAAYNEESTVTRAIDEVTTANCPYEIELIVVEDGNADATSTNVSRVDDPRVRVHHHAANKGRGAALLAPRSRLMRLTERCQLPYVAKLIIPMVAILKKQHVGK